MKFSSLLGRLIKIYGFHYHRISVNYALHMQSQSERERARENKAHKSCTTFNMHAFTHRTFIKKINKTIIMTNKLTYCRSSCMHSIIILSDANRFVVVNTERESSVLWSIAGADALLLSICFVPFFLLHVVHLNLLLPLGFLLIFLPERCGLALCNKFKSINMRIVLNYIHVLYCKKFILGHYYMACKHISQKTMKRKFCISSCLYCFKDS